MMTVSEANNRIADTGQAGFLLALTICSILFAVGFSITVFGLTTPYLVTLLDKVGVIATGSVLMVAGAGIAHRVLTP